MPTPPPAWSERLPSGSACRLGCGACAWESACGWRAPASRLSALPAQVVHTWSEAVLMMLELLPGHPSAQMLRLPQGRPGQLPRRLWGSRQRAHSADTWPVQ